MKATLSEKEAKAVQIVADGRVTIDWTDGEEVATATVEGDTGRYKVTVEPDGAHCDCKASTLGHRRCSHIIATEVEIYRQKEAHDS